MSTTTITATHLTRIAPSLDAEARETAHAKVDMSAPEAARIEAFVEAYLIALARSLGHDSAGECASGEEWAPAGWLAGDWRAIEEAVEVLEATIDDSDRRALWAAYEGA